MVQFKDAKEFEFTWRNNGIKPDATASDAKSITMEDAMSSPNATEFFPVIVENYVREAIEPVLVGARLLNRVNYKLGTHISFAAVGAIAAADIDEGMEYPERQIQTGPGVVITTIGKSGVAFKFTDEMKRYSQYDIVGLHIRECGRALGRHKEKKIWNMIERYGVVTHDNVTPGSSVYGVTGGRSLSGAGNGALIVDNIYESYTQVLMNGFTPKPLSSQ